MSWNRSPSIAAIVLLSGLGAGPAAAASAGWPGFRGDAALGTWIYRLAMNVCLSFLAKRSRRGQIDSRIGQSPEPTPPRVGNPWLRDQLERALAELPDGYRAVLILHDVEGLNHQEIAEIIGCRVGTSKSQLHKARMRMRKLLGSELDAERESKVIKASEVGA